MSLRSRKTYAVNLPFCFLPRRRIPLSTLIQLVSAPESQLKPKLQWSSAKESSMNSSKCGVSTGINLLQAEMEARPSLVIFYGSQTGNAQDVAERIGREAERRHLDATIISMDTYDPRKLCEEANVVFVVSTTGQGDPPDTVKDFWKFLLRRSLNSDWLDHLNYVVFGLGDSSYAQYNVMAKKLDKRLNDLGGKPIIERGLGDDQHPSGYEAALDPWLAHFWKVLGNILGLPLGSSVYDSLKLDDPKYHITYCDKQSLNSADKNGGYDGRVKAMSMVDIADGIHEAEKSSDSSPFGPRNPYLARVICNKKLTNKPDERDVRHIEFDLGESGLVYKPGDVLAVMPSQREEDVDAFLSRSNLDPDLPILINAVKLRNDSKKAARGISYPVTIKTIVQYIMDIASASPRRYFFEVISHFATSEHEKEKLEYFGRPEGRDDLYEYNQRERRSVLEVLQDFPSVQLPFEWLLQVVPRLKPRLFSISSSLLIHPNQAHITVAVQKWRTPLKRLRSGLCSTWLSQLDPHKGKVSVPVWIKQGSIRLPHPSVPLLLVGPGTGCAPFRAFIEERIALSVSSEKIVAPIIFFFGCRHEEEDFLYKEFWLAQTEDCKLLSHGLGGGFFVAFSRDQPRKVYVQHKIEEQSQNVWRILQSGCSIYIAGSAHEMPVDVGDALEGVIVKEGHLSKENAKRWLKQLERSGKYHVEAWQ